MPRHVALLALALLAAATLAPVGSSTDFCMGRGLVVTVGAGGTEAAHLTVDYFLSHSSGPFPVWTYLESNGRASLQRGGVTMLGDWDVCQDDADPDTGVF